MSIKHQKCDGCEFSCGAIKTIIRKGAKIETAGFICCHQSEQVKSNNFFTGKTSPHWCPKKQTGATIMREKCLTVPFVEKSDFIEFSLQPLIQRLDEGVEFLSYEYNNSTAEEYCVIHYKNKHTRKVCITADSEKAITNEVLKVL